MKEHLLEELFEKPISGEWGDDPDESQEGVRVIRTTNFTNRGNLDLSNVVLRNINVDKHVRKVLKSGDIIIEKSGGSPNQPVGRTVLFLEEKGIYFCNNFTSILRPRSGFDPQYLLYMMNNLYVQKLVLKFQNKTTGIINLKLQDYLQSVKVKVPRIESQKRIASLLDIAQYLIDKRKEQIEACDELVKSLFYHMFGDITRSENNTETLRDFINIVGGNAFESKGYKELGVPIVKIGAINKGFFDIKGITYWGDEEDLKRYELFPGDLVISLTGTVGKEDYGNVLMLPNLFEKYYLNQRVAKLVILDSEKLNRMFLMHLMKEPKVKSNLIGISRGVRQANLANSDIYNISIKIPPIDDQNRFADQVESIEQQKQMLQQSLAELENNFNALMQQAFKGELF